MSELIDFSGKENVSIFSLQIIGPLYKLFGFSAAFFTETKNRAVFTKHLVNLLNANMSGETPLAEIRRFFFSGDVVERGREKKLQRLVEETAQYIDDNTKGWSSTKGIIAPPMGCDETVSPIMQCKTVRGGSPNLFFARTVMFKTDPESSATMRFIITVNARSQLDMLRMTQSFKRNENAIRRAVYHSMALREGEEADAEMERIISKAAFNRAWYIAEANVSCPLLMLDGVAYADPYIVEMFLNQYIKPAE